MIDRTDLIVDAEWWDAAAPPPPPPSRPRRRLPRPARPRTPLTVLPWAVFTPLMFLGVALAVPATVLLGIPVLFGLVLVFVPVGCAILVKALWRYQFLVLLLALAYCWARYGSGH